MLQTISLLVENKPGALMRVTGVLSARGGNIDSLTVARTLDAATRRMTIVVDVTSMAVQSIQPVMTLKSTMMGMVHAVMRSIQSMVSIVEVYIVVCFAQVDIVV